MSPKQCEPPPPLWAPPGAETLLSQDFSFEDPVKQTFLEPRPRHSENRWMTSRCPESISVLACFLPRRGSARHRGSIIFPLPAATSGVPARRRAKPSLALLKFRSLNKPQCHLCPQTSKAPSTLICLEIINEHITVWYDKLLKSHPGWSLNKFREAETVSVQLRLSPSHLSGKPGAEMPHRAAHHNSGLSLGAISNSQTHRTGLLGQ